MPEAQLAMSRPIVHHRTAQFTELLLETRKNLQKIFETENDIVILTSSGTGAMEAAGPGTQGDLSYRVPPAGRPPPGRPHSLAEGRQSRSGG